MVGNRDGGESVKKIPDKSPIPLHGESWHWSKRYFDIGEVIHADVMTGGNVVRMEQAITAIKVNQYGRVSYWFGETLVLLEDFLRFRNGGMVVTR